MLSARVKGLYVTVDHVEASLARERWDCRDLQNYEHIGTNACPIVRPTRIATRPPLVLPTRSFSLSCEKLG